MSNVCPYCKYDHTTGKIVQGGVKGAAVAVVSLLNPFLGAAALTGLALKAWMDSGKTEFQCANCGKYFHD